MKIEINLPKMPKINILEFKRITNPFTNDSVRGVGIVLAVLVFIAGAVYSTEWVEKGKTRVLPATVQGEETSIQEATNSPIIKRTATASPTIETRVTVIPTEVEQE